MKPRIDVRKENIMKNKWIAILTTSMLALAFLAGCGSNSNALTDNETVVETSTEVSGSVQDDSVVSDSISSDQAAVTSEVESAAAVEISAESSTINLSDYGDNGVVSINAAGEYVLSGTLANGQVVINVGNEDTVQLYLNNASITNNSGSAIYVQNAGEVVVTLVDGTVNTVTDGASYTGLDENGEPDATIFSHDDLTINGSGSLAVQIGRASCRERV